ncbi:MAG: hypothetical protein K2Z81_25620 [Cyanobacteria bacterium]|nr:hypothetical protein [Cyanobacteriota bacterium]
MNHSVSLLPSQSGERTVNARENLLRGAPSTGSVLAGTAAGIIVILTLGLMSIVRHYSIPLDAAVSWRASVGGNRSLLIVYVCAVALTCLVSALPLLAERITRSKYWSEHWEQYGRLTALMMIAFCAGAWFLFKQAGLGSILGLATFLLLLPRFNHLRAVVRKFSFLKLSLPIALFAMSVAALVPGLLTQTSFAGWWSGYLVPSENSYSVVMMVGDKLVSGAVLFKDVVPRYGSLFPLLLAGWQKNLGQISFGGYIAIVAWFQVIFAVCAAYLYKSYSRRVSLPFLFSLGIMLIPLSTSSFHVFFPNQAAIRFIGLPIAIFFLCKVPSLRKDAVFLLSGLLSATLVLLNFETGLVAAAGLVTYVLMMRDRFLSRKGILGACFLAALGAFLAFGLFLIALYLVLGQTPSLPLFLSSLVPLSSVGISGSANSHIQPIMVFAFIHCTYVLIKTAWLSATKGLGHRQSLRTALAVMTLLWLAYYVNKQGLYAVVGSYFLYGFFLIDTGRVALTRRPILGNRFVENRWLAAFVIGTLAVPFACSLLNHHWPRYAATCQRLVDSKAKKRPLQAVSGVFLDRTAARALLAKANFVRQQAATSGDVAYVTRHAALIPKLSGELSATGMESVYYDLRSPQQVKKFASSLVQSEREYILFDSINAVDTQFDKCLKEIQAAVKPQYKYSYTMSEWDVWERIPGAAAKLSK